jgi:hypothetical protein
MVQKGHIRTWKSPSSLTKCLTLWTRSKTLLRNLLLLLQLSLPLHPFCVNPPLGLKPPKSPPRSSYLIHGHPNQFGKVLVLR